jgi:hypothetical protein
MNQSFGYIPSHTTSDNDVLLLVTPHTQHHAQGANTMAIWEKSRDSAAAHPFLYLRP